MSSGAADIRALIEAASRNDTEQIDSLRQRAGEVFVRASLVDWIRSHPRDLFLWTGLDILAEGTIWAGADARTRAALANRIRSAPNDPSTMSVVQALTEATMSEGREAWSDVVSLLRTFGWDSPLHAAALAAMALEQDLEESGNVEYFKDILNHAGATRDAQWWASCALGRTNSPHAIEAVAATVSAPHLDDDCRFVLLAGLDRAGRRSSLEAFALEGGTLGHLALALLPAAGEDADSLILRARTATEPLQRFSAKRKLVDLASLGAVRARLVEWIRDNAADPFVVDAVDALAEGAIKGGPEVWETVVSSVRPFPYDSLVHEALLRALAMELHREESLGADAMIVDYCADMVANAKTSTEARRWAASALGTAANPRAVEVMAVAVSAPDLGDFNLMLGLSRAGAAGRAKVEAFAAHPGELGELARLVLGATSRR
jgi:hypothetical protein